MPIIRDNKNIPQKMLSLCSMVIQATKATRVIPRSALRRCWPGNVSGAPVISPCSFPNAIIEPVNVIAPIAKPIDISIKLPVLMSKKVPIP